MRETTDSYVMPSKFGSDKSWIPCIPSSQSSTAKNKIDLVRRILKGTTSIIIISST